MTIGLFGKDLAVNYPPFNGQVSFRSIFTVSAFHDECTLANVKSMFSLFLELLLEARG